MSTSSWVRDTLEGRSGPRRPALSVLAWVGIGVCGVVALAYGLIVGVIAGGGVGAFLLGLLFAVLPVPLLVFAVLSLDRLEPEPTRNLVLTFAWGAAVSVALALGLQVLLSLVIPSERFGLVVAAPVTEELAKGLIIFLILHLRKTELDGPTDGLVYAGMVGLGFAFSENIVYYGQSLGDGAGNLVGTFVLRGVFSPLAHPLFTAATGVALGFAALKRDTAMRWLLPIGGLILAMILHGVWNGSSLTPFGILGLAAFYLLIMLPILVGCILIAYFDRRRVLRQIAVYLPAYAPAGVFNRDEVHLLATMKARRKMRHLMRDYQQAATELAMLDDHAARGTAGPEYGPRREALVRILLLAKQAFPGNEGAAANLAQVEGTLPPPPLPREGGGPQGYAAGPQGYGAGPQGYGPPAGYGGPPPGYGPRPGFGPPHQDRRPVPPPGSQGLPQPGSQHGPAHQPQLQSGQAHQPQLAPAQQPQQLGHQPERAPVHQPSHQPSHQPESHQPESHQPGSHQPGSHQPGSHQPGSHQPGSHQPGSHQPGSHQPESLQGPAHEPQLGSAQPGPEQPRAHQPTSDQGVTPQPRPAHGEQPAEEPQSRRLPPPPPQ